MTKLTGPLFFFLLSGNYLLFRPVYRLFYPKQSQRSQALFRLFLLQLGIYLLFTAAVIIGFLTVRDFHHALFFVEIIYLLLAMFLWAATFGVWADNRPDSEP